MLIVVNYIITALKFLGILGGLSSPAFLIYDRVYRYRPIMFLFPAEFKANLRIKNLAPETIIIDEIVIDPPVLKVAQANDLFTVSEDQAASMYPTMKGPRTPDGAYIIIKPEGERTFALHFLSDLDSLDGANRIAIRCRWSNTRKPYPFRRYVKIRPTVEMVRNVKEASFARKV